MKILAIETSCDDTSVSIVIDGRKVFSNVILSQSELHSKTGGVVPEVAAREHIQNIVPAIQKAFYNEQGDKIDLHDIDAIAVTQGPGLISSLIIGTQTASTLSYLLKKPLIAVNHIFGHLYSNWLGHDEEIGFPLVILTVSGGHNELILMHNHYEFEVLGATLDDAAGEVFDKVARILGLPYPGGPQIAKIALEGNAEKYDFPRVILNKNSFDFSFSGLKTAVLYQVKDLMRNSDQSQSGTQAALTFQNKADIAASFQQAVVEIFCKKIELVLEKFPHICEIHLAGGVSANLLLRSAIANLINKKSPQTKFRYPQDIRFCTDNAAMIGAAAYFKYLKDSSSAKRSYNVTPFSTHSG